MVSHESHNGNGYHPPPATVAPDAEKAVLGAMIFGRDDERLTADQFYHESHQRMFACIADMQGEGETIDAVTLARELQRRDWLADVGGPSAVAEVMASVPYADDIETYASQVIDAAKRRTVKRVCEQAAADAMDSTLAVDDIEAKIVHTITDGEVIDRRGFETLTSAQLAAAHYDLTYHFDNLLVEGQPMVLAGPRKSLKTNLIIDLGISGAVGGWFLQKFKSNRRYRVGIMSGESGQATIQETARRVCRAKEIELASVEGLVWCFDLPTFGQLSDEHQLQRFVEKNELEILVLDPAYLCLPIGDDAGNLFKVGHFLKTFTRIAETTGCTPIIAHHTRKRGKGQQSYDPMELDDIAWAGFQEWARQWLLLGRREAYDPSQGGSHKLWLSSGGSAGHSGLWGVDIEEGIGSDPGGRRWNVRVLKASEVITARVDAQDGRKAQRKASQRQADIEAVRTSLTKAGDDGGTKTEIRESAGLSGTRFAPALDNLIDDGLAERCEVTKKNGQTYDGYRLTRTDRDAPGQSGTVPMNHTTGTDSL